MPIISYYYINSENLIPARSKSLTFREEEVVWIEVDGTALPPDLVCVADAPAQGVEHGHDDATGEDDHPADQ